MNRIIWRLFMFPSSYGLLVWSVLVFFIAIGVYKVNVSQEALAVFLYVIICFGVVNCYSYFTNRAVGVASLAPKVRGARFDIVFFVISTVIGIFGLFLYVKDFSGVLGGYANFYWAFAENPLIIRALAAEETSIGFQLSYFSWISIFYCVYFIISRQKYSSTNFLLFISAIAQFSANLLFIDRTRPVILFFASCLIIIFLKSSRINSPVKIMAGILMGPIAIFLIQGSFTGKFDQDFGLFNNLLEYLFGGFGYFSAELNESVFEFELMRTFYPLAKVISYLDGTINVPSQILDFRNVPFPTNVGTFLEPLLADGGIWYVISATPLLIFFMDFMAFRALRSGSVGGLFFWANLILVAVFSFFVPKYNSAYFYLFALLYLVSSAGIRSKTK